VPPAPAPAPGEHPFAELIQDYVAECLPLAERVTDTLIALERRWAAGDPAEEEFAPLKGLLHTIKGNSAMMGLVPLQELAHALEDVWGLLAARPELRPQAADLLLRGSGLLADLIRSAATAPPDAGLVAAFREEAREFLGATAGAASAPERRQGERRQGERRQSVATPATDTVRVTSRRLDQLLEIFGEAIVAQASLEEAARALGVRAGARDDLAALDRALTALQRTLRRFERAVMEVRLLPVDTVFGRFGRLVRELARAEAKQVRLETTGGETQLDKTIIDRLGEPLVHLVTNAVIHGVEPPAERVRRGKPAEAVITLAAASRSDRVLIEVRDDGRGLDTERIRLKARALGVTPASDDPEDIYALAFLPGLSTTDEVSELAGRGVGLDVVAGALRALGGGVRVTSTPGAGTTFTLTLPLTVAVVRSLLVSVGDERYAVPLNDVMAAFRVEPERLHAIEGRHMTLWQGMPIPVADATVLLGVPTSAPPARRYCVVLSASGRPRGLLVDRLLGHRDLVAKPLDPALGRPPAVAGAAILGDGQVTCLLDAAQLGVVAAGESGGARAVPGGR